MASVKLFQAAINTTLIAIWNFLGDWTLLYITFCAVTIFNSPFFRRTEQMIECIMPPALQANTESVAVCVEFEDRPCQGVELNATYTYERNPIISSIHPKKSFLRWVDRHTPWMKQKHPFKWTLQFLCRFQVTHQNWNVVFYPLMLQITDYFA